MKGGGGFALYKGGKQTASKNREGFQNLRENTSIKCGGQGTQRGKHVTKTNLMEKEIHRRKGGVTWGGVGGGKREGGAEKERRGELNKKPNDEGHKM